MPVAGVFLGAKVEGDLSRGPVRLTRDAPWKIDGRLTCHQHELPPKLVDALAIKTSVG